MPTRKTIRKRVGWSIFALLVLLIVVQVPRVASQMCYNAGRSLYGAGQYKSAAFAYRSSVALNGRFAQGYIQLGLSGSEKVCVGRIRFPLSQEHRRRFVRCLRIGNGV